MTSTNWTGQGDLPPGDEPLPIDAVPVEPPPLPMDENQAEQIETVSDAPVHRPTLRSQTFQFVSLRELLGFGLLLIGIYTLVNLATARAIVVGESMQPNFYTDQLIVVNRLVYYFNEPTRGDVIVLHDPEDPSQDFIKRLIGLPGEEVAIRAGRVYINGTLLDEPYIPVFCTTCDGTWELDADHFFVLGDNRPNSHDSHAFGPIDRRLIVGKAWIRYWPLQTFGIISDPVYGPINPQRPATPPPPAAPTLPGGPRPTPFVPPVHPTATPVHRTGSV